MSSESQAARAEVVMYRTPFCPYCASAARLLAKKGAKVREVDVSSNSACRRWLLEVTGSHTVPQIFINGRSVRGYDDIVALDRRGALDPMLSEPASAPHQSPACCLPAK